MRKWGQVRAFTTFFLAGAASCDADESQGSTAGAAFSSSSGTSGGAEATAGTSAPLREPASSSSSSGASESDSSSESTSAFAQAECGDSIAADNEECDADDHRSADCLQFGFLGGELSCNQLCQFEFGGCENFACGDGARQHPEMCDGDDLNAQSCESLGFDSGELACQPTCMSFDRSGCGECGNGQIDGAELCDGANLGGETCSSQGFDGGALGCADGCTGFATEACSTCGDGIISGDETCDGSRFNGLSCRDFGFDGGTLTCTSCSISTQSCFSNTNCCESRQGSTGCEVTAVQACVCAIDRFCCDFEWDGLCVGVAVDSCNIECSLCGNNNIEDGELCDGNQVGEQSCITQGFDSGTLVCDSACNGYDTSNCGTCGDGIVSSAEQCDGANLDGQTCTSLGESPGVLACNSNCRGFDTSGCNHNQTPSWASDIQPIWDANCSCHSGGFAPEVFMVAASTSYSNTVNVASSGMLDFIEPSNSGQSLIVRRIEGTGGYMPPAPAMPLSAGEIAMIRAWIDAGAPNN